MSEADVIRGHIISDAEAIDGEWGCVHEWADMTPKCAGYADAVAALAALDSLATRLAEVTNRMHVLQAQLDDSATRLAEVEAQRDELDRNLHGTGGVIDSLAEAYERIAEVERERDEARSLYNIGTFLAADDDSDEDALRRTMKALAEAREQLTQAREAWQRFAEHVEQRHACDWGYTERPEALATINQDGHLWNKVGGPGQPRVATINREGETEG